MNGSDVPWEDNQPNSKDEEHVSAKQSSESEAPPPFDELIREVDIDQNWLHTHAEVLDDGRIDVRISEKSRRLSQLFEPALDEHLRQVRESQGISPPKVWIPPELGPSGDALKPPPLNVVIQLVGSRGDVQPFIALGQVLKETYGHRVRIATHHVFRSFVEENGLEFFNIGGDPAALMAFMVKNPSLIPTMETFRHGEIDKRKEEMLEIMVGCWKSCYEASNETPEHEQIRETPKIPTTKQFVADVIIANPPSFAHIHCAQKLGIPLHLMFTMPWSRTQAFPHPLANIKGSEIQSNLSNFMSYPIVELLMWQGLGNTVNRFRTRVLGLERLRFLGGIRGTSKVKLPHTYCWSPALIPKPEDWADHISVAGFFFLPPAKEYVPESALQAFLEAGPPPIYIGFGSIVVDNPKQLTKTLFSAIRMAGQRAVVSIGWGSLCVDSVPKDVFILGNVPHNWLFQQVSCVVHHGGAGTTAAGIQQGKPTVVIPFFGDQQFWGSMIATAGAGPEPLPFNRGLTAEDLAAAITTALGPKIRQKAIELGRKIQHEKGVHQGAVCFHQQLDVDSMRCHLHRSRSAVWRIRRTNLRLSAFAATTLINNGLLRYNDLKLYRASEYNLEDGPWDPLTGTSEAVLSMVSNMVMGFADVPKEVAKVRKAKAKSRLPNGERAAKVEIDLTSHKYSQDSSSIAGQTDGSANELELNNNLRQVTKASASVQGGNAFSEISEGIAKGTSKGLGRFMLAGFRSPFEVTLHAARGFHNTPRLYGDKTVREHERITGVWSGLKAAGKGFTLGIYDGVTGVVSQPLDGLKEEGVKGLGKGIGKGIGGLALKPIAGTWGIAGYTYDGINKEISRMLTYSVEYYIATSRKAQGAEEFNKAEEEEKVRVIEKWWSEDIQRLKKGKAPSNS